MRTDLFVLSWIAVVLVDGISAQAADQVSVVVSPHAPAIERFAAEELVGQFNRIFDDVDVEIQNQAGDAKYVVLIGSPETNPAVRKTMGTNWPTVSDQGLVIHSLPEKNCQNLIVGGGSSAATLWAVYELGHRLGIRYVLHGDMFPLKKRTLDLTGHRVAMEPELRTRIWRTINDFAIGPESWGLAEHRKFLRQLAKMKFNRVMLSVYPWQPFVKYEFGGVSKSTSVLWWGNRYPVDRDTVGGKVFRNAKLFENPDFAGLSGSEEMTTAGIKHVRGLIDAANELGMSVGISISPLEFPREFQKALPGSRIGRGLNDMTIVPAVDQGLSDVKLKKLVGTKISAYLQTYPKLDRLYLTLPEFPEWGQHAEEAVRRLRADGFDDLSLDDLVESASRRNLIASGARGEQAIRGNLAALVLLRDVLADGKLLKRPDGRQVGLTITGVDPALFSVLDRIVPHGAETLNFVDYTARRVVKNRKLLAELPARKVRSQFIMTLADDNVGVLPQSASQSISTLTADLKKLGWDGFSTRYWVPGELDPSVYFLSRAAWERDLTARHAQTELWSTSTGNPAAATRLWMAWEQLEKATNLIDQNDIGFTFPVPGMLMKHYTPKPIPAWWQPATDAYTQYMVELYRSHGAIKGDAKDLLFYYAKRGEYVLEYLAAVKAVREAALAREKGNTDKALEHLENALEQTYNCINTLSDVARDQSDRGLIAVLNAYAYKPLLAEYEKLADDQ